MPAVIVALRARFHGHGLDPDLSAFVAFPACGCGTLLWLDGAGGVRGAGAGGAPGAWRTEPRARTGFSNLTMPAPGRGSNLPATAAPPAARTCRPTREPRWTSAEWSGLGSRSDRRVTTRWGRRAGPLVGAVLAVVLLAALVLGGVFGGTPEARHSSVRCPPGCSRPCRAG